MQVFPMQLAQTSSGAGREGDACEIYPTRRFHTISDGIRET